MVFQLVFLVAQSCQELQWGWGPCTMGCWLIFPTCCLRSILRLGWIGWHLACIRLSSRILILPFWFSCICLQNSWRFFHRFCSCKRSFAWHRGWRREERVLWFVLLLRYRLRINLVGRQSWGWHSQLVRYQWSCSWWSLCDQGHQWWWSDIWVIRIAKGRYRWWYLFLFHS